MAKKTAIFLILALAISSCMTERRIASNFIVKEDNINVLVLPPPGIIKAFYPDNPANFHPDSLDPLPLDESRFIGELNDTAFVNYFMRSLAYHLDRFRVNVYGPEKIDSFFKIDTIAYIFSVAQIELLEFSDKHVEIAQLDTALFRVSLPRTRLEKSIWFEFTELNNIERPREVLYSIQTTSDFYDGRFRYDWRSGNVYYEHTPYYLETPDVYDLAFFAGQKNAQYIFDYIMNLYVREVSKRQKRKPVYYQYDNERHTIRRAYNDRFIRMTPQDTAE